MYKKIFYLFLLILLVAALYSFSAYFQTVFARFTGVLANYVNHHFLLDAGVFIGLAGLSVLLGPFTSVPLVPSAVLIWRVPKTMLMLMVGWMLGSTFAFFIGWFLGYPLVKKLSGGKNWMAGYSP